MDFLSGMGEMMRREGLDELEIRDADRVIVLRRRAGGADPQDGDAGPGADQGVVTTPLGGILYLHPGAGKDPYAQPGQRKAPGDILFCIEAMKHINEVYAECELTVEEVLAGEGEAVSPRQAIMRVRGEEEEEDDEDK
jgi:biotin carboxyl carrier protein